jgi:hypothetical protein
LVDWSDEMLVVDWVSTTADETAEPWAELTAEHSVAMKDEMPVVLWVACLAGNWAASSAYY